MNPRRRPRAQRPVPALAAAVLLTIAFGGLDWWTGYEVSVLAVYLVPPALAGWHAGRKEAAALAVLGAVAWLVADVQAGHPYTHPAIPYWNAVARLAIFGAFGVLAVELRRARERASRGPDDDAMPAGDSFYRMVEREHARLLRHGRPVTLAYVDAGGVRPEGAACSVAVGAVSCAGPAGDLNQVIQRAYQLMYQAERSAARVVVSHEALEGAPAPPPAS